MNIGGIKMFNGFSVYTMKFLKNLKENNSKGWFEANKRDYEEHVLVKLQEFVKELGPYMLEIDPYIDISPKKCISRINRDLRFSKDKSPYRSNMWVSFKRLYKDWKMEPTYFFEIFPDYYRYGMGYYDIPKDTMDKVRELIKKGDEDFTDMYSTYNSQNIFTMEGQMYKRSLNNEIPEELKSWYQRKEIYFVCNKSSDSLLFSSELISKLVDDFKTIAPIYDFFIKLKDL
jgi:uncharacterized protein (TIGR02453 family)